MEKYIETTGNTQAVSLNRVHDYASFRASCIRTCHFERRRSEYYVLIRQVTMEKYNETTGQTQSVVDINLDATDLAPGQFHGIPMLSSDDVFQETSARCRAVAPEQWLQRHPEAGSSWPSWPKASHHFHATSTDFSF